MVMVVSLVWMVSAVMFVGDVGGESGLLKSDQKREVLKDEMVEDMYVVSRSCSRISKSNM